MIPYNRATYTGNEERYVLQAMRARKLSGDGPFNKKCQEWFESYLGCCRALMTPSCTHALELAALLIEIEPGDEVIMPSYTFVSTANAFVLRGATIVFADIRPDTLNLDETQVEAAITERTRAIVPVHYAGVPCDMDSIMAVAERYNLYVIEDAAQGMMSRYKERPLGTMGHFGAYSFHETKNYTSGGEGGLLIVNDDRFVRRAEILQEKGTNRSEFFRGTTDKYSWVDLGSSYLLSDIQAAYLWGQLEEAEEIVERRLKSWYVYNLGMAPLAKEGKLECPMVPSDCTYNAHMYFIKVADIEERGALIDRLRENGLHAVFHYVPLHSAVAGRRYGRFHGEDRYTSRESARVIRLPLWHGIDTGDQGTVVEVINEFYA